MIIDKDSKRKIIVLMILFASAGTALREVVGERLYTLHNHDSGYSWIGDGRKQCIGADGIGTRGTGNRLPARE